MSTVHFVVPAGLDDPRRPSGGNVYDRRLIRGLTALGWSVHEHAVEGSWPRPRPADLTGLAAALATVPDGALVLLDGLVASAAAEVLVPAKDRWGLVVLVHLPLGEAAGVRAGEDAVLAAAAAVVTTSGWTRDRLLDRGAIPADRIRVAEPGVSTADLASGTPGGGELVCVAAVAPHKGHDVLLAALALIDHLPWHCTCVGSLERDPAFVDALRRQARASRLDGRVRFTGALTGERLAAAYAAADVLVLASRGETFSMVVTEALARGLPVIASDVGGVPLALGRVPGGGRPGILVPPEDPSALAEAIGAWLGAADLRRRLRSAAAQRRTRLAGWSRTAECVSRVLVGAA